jgi:hypothetical protein
VAVTAAPKTSEEDCLRRGRRCEKVLIVRGGDDGVCGDTREKGGRCAMVTRGEKGKEGGGSDVMTHAQAGRAGQGARRQ